MTLGELARRVRYLLFRRRYTAELEEEIRLHIDLRTARLREQGLSPAEARYAAGRRFGNAITVQEESRDMWGFHLVEHAIADMRFAGRRLRRRPGFSIAAVTVAALGIGATTAVFSAIDAALLRPLPFVRPSELVALTNVNIPFDAEGQPFREGRHILDLTDVAAMTDVFSHAAAFAAGGLNLADPVRPERVRAGVVTAGFFETLGARPQAGRTFDSVEGKPHGPRVVILSDALWSRRFGRAPIVGTTIDLNGARYTVIGIMERGFDFPNESDLWIPLTVPTTFETFAAFRGWLPSQVIARMAPGVSLETARSRLLANWLRFVGSGEPGRRSNLDMMLEEVRAKGAAIPLHRDLVGDGRNALLLLFGATALLLLIACANVANLIVADATSRRREVALREALGASHGRIVRQLLSESVMLAVAGAMVGIALAPAVLRVLRAVMPADLAGVAPVELDLRVLAFAVVLAVLTGIVFGLWPALGSARVDAAETIKAGGGLGTTASGLGRARRVLVTVELALTVMLLIGSGLMLRSLERVLSQDLGMNPTRVGTLEMSFHRGVRRSERLAAVHAMLARLEQDRAMEAVAVVNDLPLRGQGGISLSINVAGAPKAKANGMDEMAFARFLMASGGYFKALGVPLLRGRTFTAADDSLAPPVAVISAAMAKKWWPNTDPLGKTFRMGGDSVPLTVVGVVADVRERSLEKMVNPQMYLSVDRETPDNLAIVARSTLPPSVLLARLTEAVHAVNPAQAVYNVRMMDAVVSNAVAPRRTNTTLITLFGGVALLLSAFGVYAVVSYGVTRRTREFGIRSALGATGRTIAVLVAREMAGAVALGLVIGVAGAWALARVIAAFLYRVDTHDLPTYALACLVLLVPAAIATALPAWRAMSVHPASIIREE